MAQVNIVKQIKIDGNWVLRSIPKKPSGTYDWTALPEGTYFIEWRENGQRKREPAGITASQALEAQRKKRHSLEGHRWNIRSSVAQPSEDAANSPLQALIERYLEQVETLKKPNTFRKYECVLQRFGEHFRGRTLSDITVEQLNDFVVKLKKRRHVGEHGPSQRDHHRAVLEEKWDARDYQTAAIAGTDPASSQGIHGAGVASFSLPAIPGNGLCFRLSC